MRLERAAAFVARLHALSIKSPHSWRRAASVGRDIDLNGPTLELVIRHAEKAGLMHRRADDAGYHFDCQGGDGWGAGAIGTGRSSSVTVCLPMNCPDASS